MDLSSLFKAYVKTVMLHNKAVENSNNLNTDFKINRKQNLFVIKIHTIAKQIENLYEILINKDQTKLKFKYLSHNSLSTLDSANSEFNNIGSVAQNVIGTCSKVITELKQEIMIDASQQNQEHFQVMALLVEDYLKNVCNIYSKQKAIQVQKAMIQKNICKLKCLIKQEGLIKDYGTYGVKIVSNSEINKCDNQINSSKVQEINDDISETLKHQDEQLSSEDIQLFQAENVQLLNELNILTEEVTQIEKKILHISELQEIFTEKILEQDKNLERVLITVVGSTENVKEANEQIRKAIQRHAGLRVWVLFFLLMMSFTLIFLDWYNP